MKLTYARLLAGKTDPNNTSLWQPVISGVSTERAEK